MSKLLEMKSKYPNTNIWVDSCSKDDLIYGLSVGAVGATTNPVIVYNVLKKELPQWEDTIRYLFKNNPEATEDDVAWMLIEQMGLQGCNILRETYEQSNGNYGKISMQTNIKYYRDWKKMVDQAVHFNSLAQNIQVKMPLSVEGVKAIEEATYRGVSVNATVSFSICQVIAMAEAVERGLKRREEEGLSVDHITPVCTIMIGRIDDWLKKAVKRDHIAISPVALEWAGVAVFKKAYKIFKQRGYRVRLLTAAYRNLYDWQAFIGGDISMTITADYLKTFDGSDVEICNTMDEDIPESCMIELLKLKEFHRAYDEDGMTLEESEHYGAFITCLEGFFKGYEDLLKMIRPYQFGDVLN